MVRLLQLPAGKEYKVLRKMVWLLMWFLMSELIKDNHFVSATTENHRPLQNASKNIHEFQKNSSVSNETPEASSVGNYVDSQLESNRKVRAVPPRVKMPNKESYSWDVLNDEILGYVRKIPIHVVEFQRIKVPRPGRSDNIEEDTEHLELFDYRKRNEDGKINTLIPILPFGRSYNKDLKNLDTESSEDKHVFSERSNTIIPIARPGRNSNKIKRDTSSVIPYPRLGRFSTLYGDEDFSVGKVQTNFMDNDQEFVDAELKDFDFNDSVQRREEHDESSEIMPFPQGSHSDSGNIFYSQIKRQNNSEYIIPQIRYGRSMLLLSTTKNDKSAKEKPQTFVLPYPRPGRSNEENGGKFKYSNVLLPFPNPGRFSNEYNVKELDISNEKKRQVYMLPTARLGRSSLNMRLEDENIQNTGEAFLGLKVNPFFLKNLSEKSKDLRDSGSPFVIPYPRPGKKSTMKIQNPNKGTKTNSADNEKINDYVLPYPRPGRSYYDWIENKNSQGKHHEIQNKDYETFVDQNNDAHEQQDDDKTSTGSEIDISKLEDASSGFRFKRSNTILPYPRPGRSNFVVPYPRLGRSNTVIPYPRFGRSNTVLPYPRPGRSNSVIPYPRLGRSNSVIPYPRPGRSNSVIPYPRLGRSNTVVLHSRQVIPYPRLGRSVSVIPYPRPGRSNSYNSADGVDGSYFIIPTASNSNFLNHRLRKSNYITPYPRPGRAQDQLFSPNFSQGREYSKRDDTYIVPYPRPGRFIEKKGSENNMILPYPRPGRSNGKGSGYVLPYPRVGRSEYTDYNDNGTPIDGSNSHFSPVERFQQDTPPYPLNSVHRLNKHMSTKAENSIYILPYPRPGRYLEKEY